MSPQECIAALDRALDISGNDVILRRTVGEDPNQTFIEVECRAFIRLQRVAPEDLGSVRRDHNLVIISPTAIAATNWPASHTTPFTADDIAIPTKLDKVVIDGVPRPIRQVDPIAIQNEVVRLEIHLIG
jgi:hypothetical protein